MLEYKPEEIKEYLKELNKLGIQLDLEDVMGVSFEDINEIGFVIDGEMIINKNKLKSGE